MYKVVEPYFNDWMIYSKNNMWGIVLMNKNIYNIVLSDTIYCSNIALKDKVKPKYLAENEIAFKLNIVKELCDKNGYLDKGAIGSLIDMTTFIVSAVFDNLQRRGVSIEVSSKFIRNVEIGESVIVISKLNKIEGNIAFSTLEIYNENDLSIIAICSHTEYMKNKEFDSNYNDIPKRYLKNVFSKF